MKLRTFLGWLCPIHHDVATEVPVLQEHIVVENNRQLTLAGHFIPQRAATTSASVKVAKEAAF